MPRLNALKGSACINLYKKNKSMIDWLNNKNTPWVFLDIMFNGWVFHTTTIGKTFMMQIPRQSVKATYNYSTITRENPYILLDSFVMLIRHYPRNILNHLKHLLFTKLMHSTLCTMNTQNPQWCANLPSTLFEQETTLMIFTLQQYFTVFVKLLISPSSIREHRHWICSCLYIDLNIIRLAIGKLRKLLSAQQCTIQNNDLTVQGQYLACVQHLTTRR